MTDIIIIPLSKLVESEDNVRRSDRRGGVSQIAASIEAVGLRRLMADYVAYYNSDRTHCALGKETPLGRSIERRGGIVSEARVGSLHRRYRRVR